MKKLLILLPVFFLFGMGSVLAQLPAGGGQAQFREQQKQRLKDSLNLTETQIETVLTVQQEFQPKMREIRMDQTMSDADKQTKMKELNDERTKKWGTALKDETLAKKIADFYARMPQGRGNRPQGAGNN